jgi:Flp pilus assembly protein TadG
MYLDRYILQDSQEALDPRRPPRCNRRVGATAVEFALVAPIMFLFFLGIFELGRTLMVMELMTEAARVGCRKGIVEGTSSQQIQDAVNTFLSNSGINSQQVSISINDSSANTIEAKDTPAYTEVTVVVSVPVSKISWVPNPLYTSGMLSGQFTMRRE